MKIEKTCLFCEKKYLINSCWDKKIKGGSKTCSRDCADNYQRRFRVKKICKVCGEVFSVVPVYKDRFSTCGKKSCRELNKFGVNNPNYKHGKYTEQGGGRFSGKKYVTWRNEVIKRDGYKCVMCRVETSEIHVDHIKPYKWFKDVRYDVANGRVLCIPCHRKTFKDNTKYKYEKI